MFSVDELERIKNFLEQLKPIERDGRDNDEVKFVKKKITPIKSIKMITG